MVIVIVIIVTGSSLAALQSSMSSSYNDSSASIDMDSKERYYAAMIAGGSWQRVEIQHYIPGGDGSQAIVR